jgi:hypothetical protein
MSLLTRFMNMISNAVDAYAFELDRYDSIDDYIHGGGFTSTTMYIPQYDLYAHYYKERQCFVTYKSDKPFNETDESYKNIRKIKINYSFASYLDDWNQAITENRKWSDKNKDYFSQITK